MQNVFPQGKKAINDISILSVILSIFLLTSFIVTFVNAEFGTSSDTFDSSAYEQSVKDDAVSVSSVSGFTVLITLMKLALFDVGNTLGLPLWMDIIYSLLAIIFVTVIARNIWVGGGG